MFDAFFRKALPLLWRTILLTILAGFPTGTRADVPPLRVVFFGDSLTAGYGLAMSEAYPAVVKELASKEGVALEVTNAGVSGDTTAGGLRRIDWVFQRSADLVVVCLGANDGLRGLDLEAMRTNLVTLLERIRLKLPRAEIVLMRMELPPTFGDAYAAKFRDTFKDVVKEANVRPGPFLLESVAGKSDLNLPDAIHPNAAGHRLIADEVWKAIKPLVSSLRRARQQPG